MVIRIQCCLKQSKFIDILLDHRIKIKANSLNKNFLFNE